MKPLPARRDVLKGAGLAAAALLAGPPALAAAPRPVQRESRTARTKRRDAIRRGAAHIAGKQIEDLGAFGENNGIVALTALSVLALMAEGSTDGRGTYGSHITEGLDFLADLVLNPRSEKNPKGYFHLPQDESSKMHGQGFATLALATALGATTGRRHKKLRDVVEKAVTCIENAQATTGGFGYEPAPDAFHEGSVTVTVAQGLRAAKDAGIRVSSDVVKRGLHYLKRSQNKNGSFRYSLSTSRSSYALTAAALSSFFLYGRYLDDRERTLQRGLDFMMKEIRTVQLKREWYFYGNFYAAWTCWQKDGGDWSASSKSYWARWQREMIPHMLGLQSRQGWWVDEVDQFEFGSLLPTTFAVLTLAIPDETLPIFQR